MGAEARGLTVFALVAVAVAVVAAAGCGRSGSGRQDAVAERGAEVMPFDLDATTHRFDALTNGLEQTVIADVPDDTEQVELIRAHLESEQHRFERGDFSDPAHIHGDEMPGLSTLRARAAEINISYADVVGGGRLLFVTEDPGLIDALHAWGRAQTSDHGDS